MRHVILAHGLWVPGVVMRPLAARLERAGLRCHTFSYLGAGRPLEAHAARLARFARELPDQGGPAHFVGHSLGGLVILRMLENERGIAPGRVVLEGVPYRGSAAGRALAANRIGARALGRSMREWLEASPPGPCGREVGVIAGTLGAGLGRLIARGLPVPNDGTVAVAETEFPAAADRIALPVSHTGMLVSRTVARQICAFLRDGRFERGAT